MSRSRAVNRSNRFNAKRRRRTLRSGIPGLQDDSRRVEKTIDHSQDLLRKAAEKETLADLMDPQTIV